MSQSIEQKEVDTSRLWSGGFVAIILAVIGNLIVGFLAGALLSIPPEFAPLSPARYVAFTVIGMVTAVIVYAILAYKAKHPIRTFQRIAWVVLVVSMLPDIAMLMSDAMPGTTTAGVVTLMVMHLVAGLVAIYGLPMLTKAQ